MSSHPTEPDNASLRWRFAIDVGGTFTDVVAIHPVRGVCTFKLLSSGDVAARVVGQRVKIEGVKFDHDDASGLLAGWQVTTASGDACADETGNVALSDGPAMVRTGESAPVVAIRLLTRTPLERELPPVELRLGTTRGTNALIERTGSRVGLVTTRGFADVLAIGNQDRPDLFALEIEKPQPLAARVVEIDERVSAEGRVLRPLDAGTELRATLQSLSGCDAIAVSLVNSYRRDDHERAIAREAAYDL